MKRREFLGRSAKVAALSLSGSVLTTGAWARECTLNDHLLGALPRDANATVSNTGEFHHFHFLHIPQEILTNPPKGGWTTISSLMIADLGIDDFFFRRREIRKQFHCHQVYFSLRQLQNISAGVETQVTAYIPGRRPNHRFVFNRGGSAPEMAMQEQMSQIRRSAERRGLRFRMNSCDERIHGGVQVFNSRRVTVVRSQRELQELQNY